MATKKKTLLCDAEGKQIHEAESARELARMLCVTYNNIHKAIESGEVICCKFIVKYKE